MTSSEKILAIINGPFGIDYVDFMKKHKIPFSGDLISLEDEIDKKDQLITELDTNLEIRRIKNMMWMKYYKTLRSGQKIIYCAGNFNSFELNKYSEAGKKYNYKPMILNVPYGSPNLAFWSARRKGYCVTAEEYYEYFCSCYQKNILFVDE